MAQRFITGSSDGLGLTAARLLIEQGHEVVLHGRNEVEVATPLAAASENQMIQFTNLSFPAVLRGVRDIVPVESRCLLFFLGGGVADTFGGKAAIEAGLLSVDCLKASHTSVHAA